MFIYLKAKYSFVGKILKESEQESFEFKIPYDSGVTVTVSLFPVRGEIKSFCELKISEKLWEILQSGKFYEPAKLSEELRKEISIIESDMACAAKKVLNLIKYNMDYKNLPENLINNDSIESVFWSKDKTKWNRMPFTYRRIFIKYDIQYLNEETSRNLQELIDNKFEPFIALRHLHRAFNEDVPRYKWIEATIAAELAIKEFLICKKPELEIILTEVPSPPLHKLYGPILEKYFGEASPKKKQLQEGAEIRNKLLHRPTEISIDLEKASEYVRNVEVAINHLFSLVGRVSGA